MLEKYLESIPPQNLVLREFEGYNINSKLIIRNCEIDAIDNA